MAGRNGGRPPKPTAAHKRDGTYKRTRHGNRTDAPQTSSLPGPPEHFGRDAVLLWCRVVDSLPQETFGEQDFAGLQAACEWWDQYCRLRDSLASLDAAIDPKGYSSVFNCVVKASQRFESLMARFGLSPVDRARLRLAPKEEADGLSLLLEEDVAS